MARTKQASKRTRRKKAFPVLGIAGVSLSLAGGASASTSGSAARLPPQNTSPHQEIFLGDEEISDVSLSTFYVFDKENSVKRQSGEKVAGGGAAAAAVAAGADAAGEAVPAAVVAAGLLLVLGTLRRC